MFYWTEDAPAVYKGIGTVPGGKLSERAIKKLGVASRNDPYVTDKPPRKKVENKFDKKGGDK